MTRMKIGEFGEAYRTIEEDTCIAPWIIATGVHLEASYAVGSRLPEIFARKLYNRTTKAYAESGYFRMLIRPRVEEGRDFLWALMRHWMAAMILERYPDSFARLPDSFTTGEGLPLEFLAKHCNRPQSITTPRRTTSRRRSRRKAV